MSPRSIVLLGSTGSIGTQTLDVVRAHPDLVSVKALAAGSNAEALIEQAREFRPRAVCMVDEEAAARVRDALADENIAVLDGEDGLLELAGTMACDMVVVATVGWAGVEPTLAALQAGRDVALANKEVLVCAGELVMGAALRAQKRVLPLDSEHNAIMQCLAAGPAGRNAPLRRIILTCSGGPFRNASREEVATAGPEQTLAHPTWSMGRKITVDSATLMNKGFEVIEAHHLFRCPLDLIEVVIHPQSIIHSMVEFVDGSMIAQLGVTDMRLPIQNVLTHPVRVATSLKPLDLAQLARLDFAAPDFERFPALRMAYDAAEAGGTVPCILNAANEVAVAAHLDNKIPCGAIPDVVRSVIEQHDSIDRPRLSQLKEADKWGREATRRMIDNRAGMLRAE